MADQNQSIVKFRELVEKWGQMYDIASELVYSSEYTDVQIEDGTDRPTWAKAVAGFLLNFNTYSSIKEALQETKTGAYFSVVSKDISEFVILYQNDNGKAVELKRYPSAAIADLIFEARDRSEAAQSASSKSAIQASKSESAAAKSAGRAQTASEASGNILFFDTHVDATSALSALDNNQIVEIFNDENFQNRQTRYRVEGGGLVFKQFPRQMGSFGLPYFGHSKYITESPQFEPDSNYASIGPTIYIADNVSVVVPDNTSWIILNNKN